MNSLLYFLLCLGTVVLMEGVAWFTHKYLMHGLLWSWHKSHHRHPPHRGLERNDLFALLFSLPAIGLMVAGGQTQWRFLFFIGLGILLYGLLYFVFHDIIVHRRIRLRFKARHPYLRRIMRAHYMHHRTHSREGAEAFGFLYAIRKYAGKSARAARQHGQ